jgi:glutamyl-tRNA synthetase/nondiscriminating glutamyl-tRNA synthetase
VPAGELRYKDLLHGEISVQNRNIEDFVLLRSDGMPTYHLSVVADDIHLEITHVIRGDDHITNTPKQILLYRAFGEKPPKFAHLPLILGPDKKKLSKRHGVTSVLDFKNMGYLPLSLLNYLAMMSWSLGDERKLHSSEEMVEKFSLHKLSKGSPVFDREKLDWLNGRQISGMDSKELFPLVKGELSRAGLWRNSLEKSEKEWFLSLIDLSKQRNRTIKEFPPRMRPFLTDEYPFDTAGVEEHLKLDSLPSLLSLLRDDFAVLDDFSADRIEKALRNRAEQEGIKASVYIHSLRMLVLGMPVSPDIFKVLELLGKEKTMDRMMRLKKRRPD